MDTLGIAYTLLCICTFVALPHPVLCTSHSVCCVFIVKCVGVYVCVYIMCVCVCVCLYMVVVITSLVSKKCPFGILYIL